MTNQPARKYPVTPKHLRKDNQEEASQPTQEESNQEQEQPKSTRKKVKLNKSKDAKTEQATSTATKTTPNTATASAAKTSEPANSLETLKKRKTFNETHTRLTTYLENEVNNKLRKIANELNIPVKELINKSLKESFKKHNL